MTISPLASRIQFALFLSMLLAGQLAFAWLLCSILSGTAHMLGYSISPVTYACIVLFSIGAAVHSACTPPPSARYPASFRAAVQAFTRTRQSM